MFEIIDYNLFTVNPFSQINYLKIGLYYFSQGE